MRFCQARDLINPHDDIFEKNLLKMYIEKANVGGPQLNSANR
jgi:hypothetical protein